MAKLKLKGKLTHPPGPWGSNRPVAGAKIRIIDIDAPGRTDDLIWDGTTDNGGVFQGTSKDWRDQIQLTPGVPATLVTPGIGPTYGPDPTDAMVLKIEITQGSNKITAPFVFAGDEVQVPLFVTWGPHTNNRGSVNGVHFTEFDKLINHLVATIVKKDPIELKLSGDWAQAATPIVELINQSPLERTKRVFPNSKAGSVVVVVGGVSITISSAAIIAMGALVLGIGGLILLAGASTFLVCLGIAVVLAVVNGYVNIEASQKTTTDSEGNPNNEATIILRSV
ncbi:MAG: hypothetical protein ACKV2U_14925 [Bryobacteraceae bacterium]